MAVYIRLFHGRKDPAEQMEDWGTDGPVLGPFSFIHTTYAFHIKLGSIRTQDVFQDLRVVDDMIYYDGVYYGDWSVFSQREMREDGFKPERYCEEKAQPPEKKVKA